MPNINPNIFTYLRIALTPLIVMLLILNFPLYALALFIIAALTDILDGHASRRFTRQTIFGALLDPIADKILILTLLVTKWHFSFKNFSKIENLMFFLCLAMLVIREAIITRARLQNYALYLAFKKRGFPDSGKKIIEYDILIKSNNLGKIKMFLLVAAVSLFILNINSAALLIFVLAVLFAYFSFLKHYLSRA